MVDYQRALLANPIGANLQLTLPMLLLGSQAEHPSTFQLAPSKLEAGSI